jgi:hypothetical protein
MAVSWSAPAAEEAGKLYRSPVGDGGLASVIGPGLGALPPRNAPKA